MVPPPLPVALPVIAIHKAVVVAPQLQPASAVIVMLPVPPGAPNDSALGEVA
jgi:hypothetical protein